MGIPNKLILSCLLLAGQAVLSQATMRNIDSFMQAAHHARFFNGTVLVSVHDTILLAKGYGYRNQEAAEPNDTLSIFQIGSLSKSFTAICVMQQVEKGKLNLRDPLNRWFPFYAKGAGVTVEQLLTHTSGVWEYSRDPVFMAAIYSGHFSEADFWKLINNKPLDFEPGTQFSYSNCGYMILGYLLEKATGKPYWQIVREGIFEKSGMISSGFDFAHLENPNRATGYNLLYSNPQQKAGIVDSSYSYAAGAIYTSAPDLYRYNKALLNGSLLSDNSLKKLFTPVKNHYAFGWIIDSPMNKLVIEHSGAIPGFQCLMAMLPEEKTCIILLDNDRDPATNTAECYTSLLKLLADQPYVLPRLPVQLAPDSLLAYAGDFELTDNPSFKAQLRLEGDQLQVAWGKDPFLDLFAEQKDYFFLKVYDLQCMFERDAQHSVSGFTARSAGKSYVYRRIH